MSEPVGPPMSQAPPASITRPSPPPGPPLNRFQRAVFKMLIGLLWLVRKLPDKPLYRAAFAIGAGTYLLMPERRDRVRDNLQRVCDWLVANDMATPTVARAARDRRGLDRMVRATFGHWVVTYAEAALSRTWRGTCDWTGSARARCRCARSSSGLASRSVTRPTTR